MSWSHSLSILVLGCHQQLVLPLPDVVIKMTTRFTLKQGSDEILDAVQCK